jgi:uncharacterized membrane-anchored protein
MTTAGFADISDRYALSNELHARPFPSIEQEGHAICIAFRLPDASSETRDAEYAQLIDLLDRYGAAHPPKGANHYWGSIGHCKLKWERHTEFLTYTLFMDDPAAAPFSATLDVFPESWRKAYLGQVVTATMVHIRKTKTPDLSAYEGVFETESLAVARVLDDDALIAGDFRIDGNGFVRFVVLSDPDTGPRRLGRIVQRLFEIETYKAMSLLSLPSARAVGADLGRLGPELGDVVAGFANDTSDHNDNLHQLLRISAHLENLTAQNAARFSAAEAYSAIVNQRISVLREERHKGRQTFSEFMMRRYDPAMRTCASTAKRLAGMTKQAARAGEMLRTRTDFAREEQNQDIMERMDQRAAQQLKLQKTVEGLSVVAVSYYAVNLAAYLLAPFAGSFGLSKTALTAALTLPIIALVWLMIRSIRKHL